MSTEIVLHTLREDSAFMRQVIAWEHVPPRPARYADAPAGLQAELIALLQSKGSWPLYSHQAQALQAALAGENVVVVSGVASGKTLCYNLPVLQALYADPTASALYLFPTKALAQDQWVILRELAEELGESVPINLYDGDTPSSRRAAVRRAGGVVMSNPDMLHAGILPHHTRWARLLTNLRFVVLDEIHTYRGVFGSHVANLLRRLRRICRFYGSDPRFVCTSATIANPAEHAGRLIEAPVTLVNDDGSPQGERHFLFYNPPLVDPAMGIRLGASRQSVHIASTFLRSEVQTILFARSRMGTELLLTSLRERLAAEGVPAERVQGYRGGYLPSERRAIERGLRTGDVRGVVATNALELGVDIGELSACILVGYPGSIASTRQQAGRVGRRLESSAAVLVAESSPLDQYMVTHPHFLLARNPEHALINPDNLVILANHLKCAVYELPFQVGECFGDANVEETLALLAEAGYLHRDRQTYHWVADEYPAASISLRSGSNQTIVIQDISNPGRPVTIGQMEQESAPFLLYAGAIYTHAGQSYLVELLDWEGFRADVRPISVEYFTRASQSGTLQILHIEESSWEGAVGKHHGRVLVTTQATAYRMIKRATHETLGWGEIDLPPQQLETTAYWFTLTPELTAQLVSAGVVPAPLDYGPNWRAQKRAALLRDSGRCQHCGAPPRPGRQHDIHHIRPFRTFGYIPGENDFYRPANALENLVALCPTCHRRAESRLRMRSGLAGLASLLRNLAPLFLMCATHDIFVLADVPGDQGLTVTVYERVPAGVGFSRQLYRSHTGLLAAAGELVRACACRDGCPACVGPPGEVGAGTKEATLQLLAAISVG